MTPSPMNIPGSNQSSAMNSLISSCVSTPRSSFYGGDISNIVIDNKTNSIILETDSENGSVLSTQLCVFVLFLFLILTQRQGDSIFLFSSNIVQLSSNVTFCAFSFSALMLFQSTVYQFLQFAPLWRYVQVTQREYVVLHGSILTFMYIFTVIHSCYRIPALDDAAASNFGS